MNVCVAGAIMRPPSKKDLSTENLKEQTDDRKCVKRTDKGGDVLIFKNISYHFICINNSLFCFASSIVYVHLSAFAIGKLHVTDSQATNLISVIGIATFVGRLAFGFLAQHPRLKPIYIYTFTFSVAGLATCLVPLMTNYEQILVYCVVFGLSFAALGGALLPCILIDIAGLDRLSFSYGVLIFYEAVGQILGAPVAGKVGLHTLINNYTRSQKILHNFQNWAAFLFVCFYIGRASGSMVTRQWECFSFNP